MQMHDKLPIRILSYFATITYYDSSVKGSADFYENGPIILPFGKFHQ